MNTIIKEILFDFIKAYKSSISKERDEAIELAVDKVEALINQERQEIIDEIKEIGGNCYKCGKWIPDCILGDACICKKDCSKNEQP